MTKNMHWQDRFAAMIEFTAETARRDAMHHARIGQSVDFYLWHKPAKNGQWGDLLVSAENPDPAHWELTSGEPLRGNVPYSQYHTWIADRARHAPIIGD